MTRLDTSVIIPTYNGSRFIAGAIASVFAQTERPREIVVVDDVSTDDTVAVVNRLAKDAPVPVKVVRMPANSGGPAGPINVGVAESTGALITILEQDDLMAPGRVALTTAAAARHPECALIIGRPAIVIETEGTAVWNPVDAPGDIPQFAASAPGETFVIPQPTAFRSLMTANFIYSNSNVTIRRSLVDRIGRFDPRWPINADADFEFRAIAQTPIAVVNEVTCGYRSRPDSVYHSRYAKGRRDGLLIRLKRGSEQYDWAPDEVRGVYWALRSECSNLFRQGDWRTGLRVARALVASPVFWRHMGSTLGVARF
jgi:glycosyltransferase involved in cell wall biosynthesis